MPPMSILKLNLRDLFWLTLVAAVASGWCAEHLRTEQKKLREREQVAIGSLTEGDFQESRIGVPPLPRFLCIRRPPRIAAQHKVLLRQAGDNAREISALLNAQLVLDQPTSAAEMTALQALNDSVCELKYELRAMRQ
jgi:hypothetical protein